MTTLAADKPRIHYHGDYGEHPMVSDDIIYEGSAVGLASGLARPLNAGDIFAGFADEHADNAAGAGSARRVRVRRRGVVQLPVTSAAITDIGKAVFASDDDTFTYTQSTNTYIGRVVAWVATGFVLVAYDADDGRGGTLTELTDNSSGTASDTIASISDTATKNAIASLAAKVNALLRRGNG